jgi:hypothetical protein
MIPAAFKRPAVRQMESLSLGRDRRVSRFAKVPDWMTLKPEMMPHLIREHEKVGRTLTEDDQSPRDNFLLVLSLTRYRLFPSPKSSPTNFRTGSMSSYFAKLVSMYLPPSLGTCNSRNSSMSLGISVRNEFLPVCFCQLS